MDIKTIEYNFGMNNEIQISLPNIDSKGIIYIIGGKEAYLYLAAWWIEKHQECGEVYNQKIDNKFGRKINKIYLQIDKQGNITENAIYDKTKELPTFHRVWIMYKDNIDQIISDIENAEKIFNTPRQPQKVNISYIEL